MSGTAIAARRLTKRFGRAAALRDLDLDVPAGRSLAVLGPNGAGKSTLLRLLAGLARPTSGSLEMFGRPATHRESRARLGYLGHATLLAPSLTARENLVFAARLYGCPAPGARADALLAEEGLTAAAHRPAASLSRGQAQRLAIARGLVHEPELVLLDEPFTGLDRAAATRLADRLRRLRRTGRTTVLVTHNLDHVAGLSDAALVLSCGRALWSGAVADDGGAALEAAFARALEDEARAT